jgi:hypothetical protein
MFNKPIPADLAGLDKAERELAEAEQALAERKLKLAQAKENLISLSPTHQLAISLHDKLCTWNHTDGCSWMYAVRDGVHDWGDYSHEKYLQKARMVMTRLRCEPVTEHNVVEFIKIL